MPGKHETTKPTETDASPAIEEFWTIWRALEKAYEAGARSKPAMPSEDSK